MHPNNAVPKKLAALSYQLKDAVSFEKENAIKQERSLCGILIMKETDGFVYINGTRSPIEKGKAFVLPVNPKQEQSIRFSQSMHGYHLQFYALENQGDSHFKPINLPCPSTVNMGQPFILQEKAKEIVEQLNRSTCWNQLKANMIFQELIYLLFNELGADPAVSLKQTIRDSRDYIHDHYQKELTREHLAKLAGLHVDYYSRKFKQHYKKSPIAYVNDVRIDHAKQLLLQTQTSIRSIAEHVGFNDEFYFSRKFKSKEGCSPTIYVNRIKNTSKIASLNHLVTGHLIALGLEPYAAIMNHSFPVVNRLNNTISIGNQKPDLERLLSSNPELIVRCAPANQIQTTKEEMFTHIAPTLTLSFEEDWRVHLNTIARLVGREQEAADFLDKYNTKVENIKNRIHHLNGETFLILGIGDGAQCVYGQRNMGTVLYGDLNASYPVGIERIPHYKEVSLQELSAFKADRIVLTIYRKNNRSPSNKSIRKQLSLLQQSSAWHSLKAVQQNKVYSIFDSKHLYTSYNALSHDLFLDKMNQLLVH